MSVPLSVLSNLPSKVLPLVSGRRHQTINRIIVCFLVAKLEFKLEKLQRSGVQLFERLASLGIM